MITPVERLVEILDETSFHYAGRTEARVAAGVASSGVIEAIAASGERSAGAAATWGLALHMDLKEVGALLAAANAELAGLSDMVANPEATRAGELFRRGSRALANHWEVEAVESFERAAQLDPHVSAIRGAYGLALLQVGDVPHAAHQFALGLRYAEASELALGVGCALMGTKAYERAEDTAAARTLLHAAWEKFPDNPDLALVRAQLLSDTSGVAAALQAAPSLAGVSLASGTPGADTAIAQWQRSDSGPWRDAQALATIYTEAVLTERRDAQMSRLVELLNDADPWARAGAMGSLLTRANTVVRQIDALVIERGREGDQERTQSHDLYRAAQQEHLETEAHNKAVAVEVVAAHRDARSRTWGAFLGIVVGLLAMWISFSLYMDDRGSLLVFPLQVVGFIALCVGLYLLVFVPGEWTRVRNIKSQRHPSVTAPKPLAAPPDDPHIERLRDALSRARDIHQRYPARVIPWSG